MKRIRNILITSALAVVLVFSLSACNFSMTNYKTIYEAVGYTVNVWERDKIETEYSSESANIDFIMEVSKKSGEQNTGAFIMGFFTAGGAKDYYNANEEFFADRNSVNNGKIVAYGDAEALKIINLMGSVSVLTEEKVMQELENMGYEVERITGEDIGVEDDDVNFVFSAERTEDGVVLFVKAASFKTLEKAKEFETALVADNQDGISIRKVGALIAWGHEDVLNLK